MASFAHMKLDFYDCPQLIKSENIPDYVLSTKLRGREGLDKLASNDFALVLINKDSSVHSKFPIHTPGDTWLSLKAFEKTAWQLPVVMQETAAKYLVEAADAWGISVENEKVAQLSKQNETIHDNVIKVTSQLESDFYLNKTASDLSELSDNWYAVVTETDRFYPLHTEDLVKSAGAWFDENYKTLAPEYRKQFADKLVWASTRHGEVVNSENVFKYAGTKLANDLEVSIQTRKHYILDSDNLHLFAELLAKSASLEPKECAKVLELLDKKAGIDKYWDQHIPDPYMSVFKMQKIADYSYCDGEHEISGEELRKFTKKDSYKEKLRAYMDKSIIDELEMNPVEVFDSLPKPEKRLLIDLMKEK